MIAALPMADGFNTLARDIQTAAPDIILVALMLGAALYILPPSRRIGRIVLGGALVFVFVASGLAMDWVNYLVGTFGGDT